jgi:glucokinase
VGFGKAGSFEGYCSGGGIAQLAQIMAREKLQMGETTAFCSNIDDLSRITAKLVADAAYTGDQTAIEVYRRCAEYLGKGLSILIDLLNPEMIIMGSIYPRAQSLIEPYMRQVIAREALTAASEVCWIAPATLGERIGDIAALAIAGMAAD